MTLQEITKHFQVVRKINNASYQCKCPVHDDTKASLTISESKGKILLHCHAGCGTGDILAAAGLTFKDLNNNQVQQYTWKERLEYGQKKRIEAIYDYQAEDGKYLYSKVRFEGKEIRYITIDKKNDSYQYCKPKDIATLYRLPDLIKAVRSGYPVYIVEGEKDVDTLKTIGYTATTAGGVNDWCKDFAHYFTGAKVVILPDNDSPGLHLKDQIVQDLKHYAHSIRWTITSETDKGDVTDYLKKEGHTKEDLQQLVNSSENIGAPWLYTVGKGEEKKLKVNGDILADSISRGLDYLIVRRPDEEKDDFFIYHHGVYKKSNRNAVKSAIRRYVPIGLASDNMINNVYNLLLCSQSNICSFRELDTDERYINLRNGLYDLELKQLKPHTPKLYSTHQLTCEYHPEDQSKPIFDRFMNDLCRDQDGQVDEEKKAILQEYGGLILSNIKVYRTKLSLVLYSLLGNSGKSQFLNLIGTLLGDGEVVNIPIQNMNEFSKFALGGIVGKRLIAIGDQTSSEIKDSSVFKQLTGGDPVKVEQKNKQPFSYIFPGGIIIACNNLPSFTDDKGGHVFERLLLVPCTNTIEQERRDGKLLDKMLQEKNAIFNWFLEGLQRLLQNNFKFTKSKVADEALNEYREKLDTVFRFLSEYYIVTGNNFDMVSKSDFESAYLEWCKDNEYTPVNKRNIKDRMEANGCPSDKARFSGRVGVMVYRKLKEKNDGFITITQEYQGELPFE